MLLAFTQYLLLLKQQQLQYVKAGAMNSCFWLSVYIKVVFSLLSHIQLFCNPMDYSLPGTSVHGISQARKMEWVAIPFPRRSSRPRNWTDVFCIAGRFFFITQLLGRHHILDYILPYLILITIRKKFWCETLENWEPKSNMNNMSGRNRRP